MNSTHASITVTHFFMTDERSANLTLQPVAPSSATTSGPRKVRWVSSPR